jgi:hypothetical protein
MLGYRPAAMQAAPIRQELPRSVLLDPQVPQQPVERPAVGVVLLPGGEVADVASA